MLLASITDTFVQFATNVVADLGLAGIFLLMLAESACIPIPSEATMLFAGFGVSQGHYSLVAVTVAGVAGNMVGSWLAYGVGYYGRMELVERHAHRLHIKPSHLAWADRWFDRYGEATVFFTRVLPIIRTFISLPAGVARMPFVRFTVFTLLGCIPWVFMLAFVGDQVGHNWTHWKNNLHYVDYAVLVGIFALVAYVIYRRRAARGASGSRSEAAEHERQVQRAEHDGAGTEDEAGPGRETGDPDLTPFSSVVGVDGERHRHAAEVPGQTEEQRDEA